MALQCHTSDGTLLSGSSRRSGKRSPHILPISPHLTPPLTAFTPQHSTLHHTTRICVTSHRPAMSIALRVCVCVCVCVCTCVGNTAPCRQHSYKPAAPPRPHHSSRDNHTAEPITCSHENSSCCCANTQGGSTRTFDCGTFWTSSWLSTQDQHRRIPLRLTLRECHPSPLLCLVWTTCLSPSSPCHACTTRACTHRYWATHTLYPNIHVLPHCVPSSITRLLVCL
jgi:hypothetical protein